MSDLPRFARHLAASAEAARRGASWQPMGLGEIVTRVMPYRGCRRALGLDSAEDYELLLLRLLAEEDGLARGFPPEAADQARGELGGSNPDLGLLRRLADATIRLDPAALAQVPDELPPRSPGQSRVRDYNLAAWEGEPEVPAAAPTLRPLPVPLPAPVTPSPLPEPDPAIAGDLDRGQPVEEDQPELELEAPAVSDERKNEPPPPPAPEPTTILADRLELEWESEDDAEAPTEEPDHAWEPVDETALPAAPFLLSAAPPPGQVPPPLSAQIEAPSSIVPAGPAGEAPPVPAPEPASASGAARVFQEPPESGPGSPSSSPPAVAGPGSGGSAGGQPFSPCPHCGQALPNGRPVRFCPSCGRNVAPLRCVRCLSELEPEWRHCVSCGQPVADGSRFA